MCTEEVEKMGVVEARKPVGIYCLSGTCDLSSVRIMVAEMKSKEGKKRIDFCQLWKYDNVFDI